MELSLGSVDGGERHFLSWGGREEDRRRESFMRSLRKRKIPRKIRKLGMVLQHSGRGLGVIRVWRGLDLVMPVCMILTCCSIF